MLNTLSKIPSYIFLCLIGLCFYPVLAGLAGIIIGLAVVLLCLVFIGIIVMTPFFIAQTCWDMIFK